MPRSEGSGPVTAAQAIVSFPHAGHCRNDPAFANLTKGFTTTDGRVAIKVQPTALRRGSVGPDARHQSNTTSRLPANNSPQ